ncbi:hypothetical protein CPC08DRAFT_660055 [Agrocybe pediades]|nr:hypothetical protein CPC08DRAFT_660055 [Agrocybe pediades]
MIPCSLAVWSAIAAALLAVKAVLLALAPRLLLFLANSDKSSLSPLEYFLAQQFSIYLCVIVLTLVLNIPSPKPPVPSAETDDSAGLTHQPMLYPLSIACLLSAFCSYNTNDVGSLSTIFFLVNLAIGLWGAWEVIFANSTSISKTTGADKHTSAFIFGNMSAASSQKKSLKNK